MSVEPTGGDGLEYVHAAHAEAEDADGVGARRISGSGSISHDPIVTERRPGVEAVGDLEVFAARIELEGTDGPPLILGQAGHKVVEEGP